MTELPDLGKHCFLQECKKLDFTPFYCKLCTHHFCSEHRFIHGCNSSRVYDGSTTRDSTPLRPYLCSKPGCSTAESIKITCPFCCVNFCLSHRHATDHDCKEIPEDKRRQEVEKKMAAIRDALGPSVPVCAPVSKAPEVKKVVSEAEQKKLDRIALMKLKLADKSGLGPNEKLIVFVEWPEGRQPVVVSKSWSVGKAVDTAQKWLNLSFTASCVTKKGADVPLDFSDTLGQVICEHETIVLTV